jgi:hypothetical protein
MLQVPYRGEGPALTDLIGGQVQAMIPSLPPSIEQIRAGKLRPLGVTAAQTIKMHGFCQLAGTRSHSTAEKQFASTSSPSQSEATWSPSIMTTR